jgi:hypothetical protein
MPRLRPPLIALVSAFPLILIAFVGWLIVDDPVTYLNLATTGNNPPLWWDAGSFIVHTCLPIVVLALLLAALVVALLRARQKSSWAAAGNVVGAAIVVVCPAVFYSGIADDPGSSPAHSELDLLALLVGVLVGIMILANAAARAQSDRRTARLIVVPSAILNAVLLPTFVALVAYATDLAIHGVPLLADVTPGVEYTGPVHVYPINALPSGYAGWLPTLVVSLVASLAALSGATYATVVAIRGAHIKAWLRAWRTGPGEQTTVAGQVDGEIDLGSFGRSATESGSNDGAADTSAEPRRSGVA